MYLLFWSVTSRHRRTNANTDVPVTTVFRRDPVSTVDRPLCRRFAVDSQLRRPRQSFQDFEHGYCTLGARRNLELARTTWHRTAASVVQRFDPLPPLTVLLVRPERRHVAKRYHAPRRRRVWHGLGEGVREIDLPSGLFLFIFLLIRKIVLNHVDDVRNEIV